LDRTQIITSLMTQYDTSPHLHPNWSSGRTLKACLAVEQGEGDCHGEPPFEKNSEPLKKATRRR